MVFLLKKTNKKNLFNTYNCGVWVMGSFHNSAKYGYAFSRLTATSKFAVQPATLLTPKSPARLRCCKNLRNDCTICDSPRDQHLMKTGLFLEVSPLYCLWTGWTRSHSPTWSNIKGRCGLWGVQKCSVEVCLCHIRRCRWKIPSSLSWKE